jgi:type II secretion system (T2SS) protein B
VTARVPAPVEAAIERRPPVVARDVAVPEPVTPKHTPPVSAPRVPPATARVPAPIERAIERRPPSTVPTPIVPAPPAEATEPSAPMTAPTVTLQVIVYSDVPAQRMVFIDGRSYREGDAFDAETVLERIAADGIVMKRRGQRFVISNPRP